MSGEEPDRGGVLALAEQFDLPPLPVDDQRATDAVVARREVDHARLERVQGAHGAGDGVPVVALVVASGAEVEDVREVVLRRHGHIPPRITLADDERALHHR